ncbi:hypothetical protein BJY04DRAFT_222499 [Aspergillus karnatakaensis]|uniref:TNT domain-containing protein n=1 Tax=Aspergillus karnatakaensis TaxID=1810916 RepID=UPI003CCD22CD
MEPCDDLSTGCNECICKNKFLGPASYNSSVNICGTEMASFFKDYKPLGQICPREFLPEFTKSQCKDPKKDEYNYPPRDGFDGPAKPIIVKTGQLLDRFGHPNGSYLSKNGDTYASRAIPPNGITKRTDVNSLNYYLYKVIKDFPAYYGKVAPWFGQPGGGMQYFVPGNITLLVDAGYLQKSCVKHLTLENGSWEPGDDDSDMEFDEDLFETVRNAH